MLILGGGLIPFPSFLVTKATNKMRAQPHTVPKIRQSFDDILHTSLRRWKTKGDNAKDVITNCALALKFANEQIYKSRNITLPFDPDILLEGINKDKGFRRTLETSKMLREIGIIVKFLILFGCSERQATSAVAQWKKVSESKVKTAYHMVREEEINNDTIGFLFRTLAVAQSFIKKAQKRKFPIMGGYPRAKTSFEKLVRVCEDEKIKRASILFVPFGVDYKEIYNLLTSIYPQIHELGNFDYSRV